MKLCFSRPDDDEPPHLVDDSSDDEGMEVSDGSAWGACADIYYPCGLAASGHMHL